MMSSIALLRSTVLGGVLLVPSLLFAQQQPGSEQPQKQPPTQKQPDLEQQKQAQQTPKAPTPEQEQAMQLLKPIFNFGQQGVALGLMANARTESPAVRKLAAQTVRDHMKHHQKIVTYVLDKKIDLVPTMEQPDMQGIESATGADFDRKFVDMIISTHQQQLTELTDQTKNIKERRLRLMIQQAQKDMEAHVQQAERVKRQLEATAAG